MNIDARRAFEIVDETYEKSILPVIEEYIAIPAKSPAFDPKWQETGHIDRAVRLVEDWCRQQKIEGLKVEVVRLEGRTPVIFMEVPGEGDDCVLLYGHVDKQPEMTGWLEDLGPWKPVRKGDKLYGRGGADDGYAAFASLTAIRVLRELGGKHARCVILIEACEESGSFDLPFYLEHLLPRLGTPSLVVCLDSGCGNYDQLWMTTSLRGIVVGELQVGVLTEGVHSGDASGVVPSSFRVARQLLSRLEDADTGKILLQKVHAEIPAERVQQAQAAGKVLGEGAVGRFPWAGGTRPMDKDLGELVLNRTWRPFLAITGAEGLPALANAGNVLRPYTTLKLSLRLPPTVDAEPIGPMLKELFEKDPPSGAQVAFKSSQGATGWNAPATAPWLSAALQTTSERHFGKPACAMGEGGTIPFMGMLGQRFPQAQFVITGVLGPQSNAHGPNEFLHVPMAKKLTLCVADVLQSHLQKQA